MDAHNAQPLSPTFEIIRKLAEDTFSVDYLALVRNDQDSPGEVRVLKVFRSDVTAGVIAEWLRLHRDCAVPLLPTVGAELQPGVFEVSSYREPVLAQPAGSAQRSTSRGRSTRRQDGQLAGFQRRVLIALADTLRWLHSFGSVHGQLSGDSLVMSPERVLLLGAGMMRLSGVDDEQRVALLKKDWTAFLELCETAGVLDGQLSPERIQSFRETYSPDRDFHWYGEIIEHLLLASEQALSPTPAPTGHSTPAASRFGFPQRVQRFIQQLPPFVQQYLANFGGAGAQSTTGQSGASLEPSHPAKSWLQPLLVGAAVCTVLLLILLPGGGAAESLQQGQSISSSEGSGGTAGERALGAKDNDQQHVIDDPVLAAERLLRQRAECYQLGSADCLRLLYEPAASGYYRDAQQLTSGAAPGTQTELSALEIVQRNGDLVLLSLVNETSPTHVHLIRVAESGWLLRDIYRLDAKI